MNISSSVDARSSMPNLVIILLLPTLLSLPLVLTFGQATRNVWIGVEAFTVTTPLSVRRTPAYRFFKSTSFFCGHRYSYILEARRNRGRLSGDIDEDDYYYEEDDGYYEYGEKEEDPSRLRPRRKKIDLGRNDLEENQYEIASPFGMPKGVRLPQPVSQALLAGVFVLGIGTGVTVDSQINTSPKDLASRDAVDQAAPNPRICSTYGASAMAFDQRVFVSFNPFNVYVAQADVKPACVLRESNVVSVLQDRGLINSKEVRACKQNMNTWAYVGDLNDYPQLSCVYKSEDAQNEFLSNPKYGIGEDVWDDDREVMEAAKRSTSKKIKDGMTEGEKTVYEKALKLKKDADTTAMDKKQ